MNAIHSMIVVVIDHVDIDLAAIRYPQFVQNISVLH